MGGGMNRQTAHLCESFFEEMIENCASSVPLLADGCICLYMMYRMWYLVVLFLFALTFVGWKLVPLDTGNIAAAFSMNATPFQGRVP